MFSKAEKKYLETYAEARALQIAEALSKTPEVWVSGVVIPAKREPDYVGPPLDSLMAAAKHFGGRRSLLILVINDNEKNAPDNVALHRSLLEMANNHTDSPDLGFSFLEFQSIDCILLDAFSDSWTFSPKKGVGLARKLGADLLLDLIVREKIESPWILSTDADAILPKDYLKPLAQHPDTSCFLFNFEHFLPEEKLHREALQIYDESLHYYVAGLRFAESPYAFHTIGSTLNIRSTSYAQVRGFPKDRQAGEDFYLLNKLAKVGRVRELKDRGSIRLSGRLSDRVPFGTGAQTNEFLEKLKMGQNIRFYDPRCFLELRQLLQIFQEIAANPQSSAASLLQNRLSSESLGAFSRVCEFSELETLFHHVPALPEKRLQALHIWFDGFRTMRFIHELRNSHFPSLPYSQALENFRLLTKC